MDDKFVMDFRVRHMEAREVRDGNALHFQGRTNIEELDGSITMGEWLTTGTVTNYGDCFDPKLSMVERLINWFKG